ncbi:hypothetical protein ACE1SV_40930 [Streptomyces sennicomposti]
MPGALSFPFTAQATARTRHAATAEGARLGRDRRPLEYLALVAAELTTGSVVHGGGSGELRVRAEDGRVPCEVGDGGRMGDPRAGRRPAARDQRGGRSLLRVDPDRRPGPRAHRPVRHRGPRLAAPLTSAGRDRPSPCRPDRLSPCRPDRRGSQRLDRRESQRSVLSGVRRRVLSGVCGPVLSRACRPVPSGPCRSGPRRPVASGVRSPLLSGVRRPSRRACTARSCEDPPQRP